MWEVWSEAHSLERDGNTQVEKLSFQFGVFLFFSIKFHFHGNVKFVSPLSKVKSYF